MHNRVHAATYPGTVVVVSPESDVIDVVGVMMVGPAPLVATGVADMTFGVLLLGVTVVVSGSAAAVLLIGVVMEVPATFIGVLLI